MKAKQGFRRMGRTYAGLNLPRETVKRNNGASTRCFDAGWLILSHRTPAALTCSDLIVISWKLSHLQFPLFKLTVTDAVERVVMLFHCSYSRLHRYLLNISQQGWRIVGPSPQTHLWDWIVWTIKGVRKLNYICKPHSLLASAQEKRKKKNLSF